MKFSPIPWSSRARDRDGISTHVPPPFCSGRMDDEGRIEREESGKISRSRDQTEWMARLAYPQTRPLAR